MIITDKEFREAGDRHGAVMLAIGAASACWENKDLASAGTFRSERAKEIANDLIRYLALDPGITSAEAAWLEVLVDNAVPREGGPMSWEGAGRNYAKRILSRAARGPVTS